MPSNWNKGLTKYTSNSVLKISQTMRQRRLDNFFVWREKMKELGKIRSNYPELKKSGDLAELTGVILGDGHIRKYPRTEELSIFSNSKNIGFIERYSGLIEKIFDKKPAVTKHSNGCTRIRIYQKHINSRLHIPYSPRRLLHIRIPQWVLKDNEFIVRYLRGLYEAEGSHCVHRKTYTYKVLFSNCNTSMLSNVHRLVKKLGFHPHKSLNQVQISRKVEVFHFLDLVKFRNY